MPAYIVLQSVTIAKEEHARERLVEAPNKAAAIGFVAKDSITAEVATIEDAMRLAKAGAELEKANGDA